MSEQWTEETRKLRPDEIDTLHNHASLLTSEGGQNREIALMLRAALTELTLLREVLAKTEDRVRFYAGGETMARLKLEDMTKERDRLREENERPKAEAASIEGDGGWEDLYRTAFARSEAAEAKLAEEIKRGDENYLRATRAEAKLAEAQRLIAGEVDPLLAGSLREQIRSELVRTLGAELAAEREAHEHTRELFEKQKIISRHLDEALGRTRERANKLREELRDFRDNWDHDEDSHRLGTRCRCCVAAAALRDEPEEPKPAHDPAEMGWHRCEHGEWMPPGNCEPKP